MNNYQNVAIIGRMNVGKSTLFNRLTETTQAIISSWAGTTRDVHAAPVVWRGVQFTLQDTGGLDVEDDEQLEDRVIFAAQRAAESADAVLFVIDGDSGVLPQDKMLAQRLAEYETPVFFVVNKIDNDTREHSVGNGVYQLGFDPWFVSAKNGRGTGELLDAVCDVLEVQDAADARDTRTKVAIVGQPNVGKSSLLNAILGEDRVIVADQAHTTREANDIPYSYKDHDFLLIDTAGLRKRRNVGQRWADNRLGAIEKKSVQQTIDAVMRADVVLMVIEAHQRISAQDKKIAEMIRDHGKALIMVVNKWDLIEDKDSGTIKEFETYFRAALPYLKWAPMMFTSAVSGVRVRETLDMVLRVSQNYTRRLTPEELETILFIARGNYKPRLSRVRKEKRKVARFDSIEQIGVQPPRFLLNAKNPQVIPPALFDIIERELRKRHDFAGVHIFIESNL